MFRPIPKKQLSALEQKWEIRLRSEGMPSEIRPLTASSERDGLKVVPLASRRAVANDNMDEQPTDDDWALKANLRANAGAVVALGDLAQTRYWAVFAQDVQSLPANYPVRAKEFLEAYAETGEVTSAVSRFPKMARSTGHRYLREFETYREHLARQRRDGGEC